MKKITVILSVVIIVIFVVVSATLIFKLPTNNVNSKKVLIALVNEDEGSFVNEEYLSYGQTFVDSFQTAENYEYLITSRTKAFNGLEDMIYDVVLVIPKNYTTSLLTYKEKKPESTIINYYTNSTIKQVEFLKGKLTSIEIENIINKTMVMSYNKELLHTFQNMQEKSQEVLEGQIEYNTGFSENIEEPMKSTYESIDNIMSESKSQQSTITTFGSSVDTFSSNIKSRINEEKDQQSIIKELETTNKETKEIIDKQNENIKTLLKEMKDNKETGNLKKIKDLVDTNQIGIEAMVDNLNTNSSSLKDVIDNMKKENKVNEWKKYIYQSIKSLLNTNDFSFTVNDISQPSGLSTSEINDFQVLRQQIYNEFIINNKAIQLIDDFTEDNISGLFTTINEKGPLKTKELIEARIIQECSKLTEDNLVDDANLKVYCESITTLQPNTTTQKVNYEYSFNNKYLNLDSINQLKIDFSDVSDGENIQVKINNVIVPVINNTITYSLVAHSELEVEVTITKQDKVNLTYQTNDKFSLEFDDKKEERNVGNYYNTTDINQNKLVIANLKAIINLYYGRDVDQVLYGTTKEILESDKNQVLDGIKQYRLKYNNESIIKNIEVSFDRETLKVELVKAYAEEYAKIYTQAYNDLAGYINSIETIYNKNNTEIAKLVFSA